MIPAEFAPVASHIWQSTLFATAAVLLTLALRRNQARVRYAILLAASYKFLVPFSWLVSLGREFQWRTAPATLPHAVSTVTDVISAPTFLMPTVAAKPVPNHLALLPLVIWAVWGCGSLIVAAGWVLEWLRLRSMVRAATPLPSALPIPVVSVPSRLEPGVFGVFRPVLLLPEGIAEKLSPAQLRVVLAHELCHVRRRDNLAAALHMLIEALFWFHPLVWWLDRRIVEERERACDEEVLRMGGAPVAYAETILAVCKSYVGSPIGCMSGISGSDLKTRILHITTQCFTEKLTRGRRVMLSIVGAMAVAGPLVFGVISAPVRAGSKQSVVMIAEAAQPAATASTPDAQASQSAATQPADAQLPSFEAVSIKPESSTGMASFDYDPGYELMQRVSVDLLIGRAYNLQQFQIVGLPSWAKDKNYDIQTKTDAATVARLQAMPPEARAAYHRLMLQSLLANRFRLQVHHVTVQAKGYLLVVTKAGKLHLDDCAPASLPEATQQSPCGENTQYPGHMELKGVPIAVLIRSLGIFTRSIVLDQTRLTGRYDITLDWTPDPGQVAAPGIPVPPPETNAPSLQTALEETVGLKLVSTKVPMDTIVIDHIEEPSPN